MGRKLLMVLFAGAIFFSTIKAQSGQSLIKEDAPTVFIDCGYCDINYIKEQIPIVNYVIDRKDADIHILFARQTTGSGGRETSLFYIGQFQFTGLNDTIKYSTNQTDTEEQQRSKLVANLKLGLVRYIARTKVAGQMTISFAKPEKKGEAQKDDWDFWLFKTSLSTFLNGQESTKYTSLYGSFSASRVTEDLKIQFTLSNSYNENVYSYDGVDYTSISRSTSFNGSLVKAIDGQWSYGFWGGVYKSTYSNIDINFNAAPGIEYNFFPYSESNRRQLRVNYKISYGANKYLEETVFFKTRENLWNQTITSSLSLIEQWGSVSLGLYGASYLHDMNKYEFGIDASCSMNLIKGLSLNLFGSYSKIRNQIGLPRGGASLEEVLLQRRQLETGYSYFGSIGFSYSFGSIYNNIVNPRFGNSGSGGVSYSISY